MNITIIPEDKLLGIDGIFSKTTVFSVLDKDIHAIHWTGTTGIIEYKSKPAVVLKNITDYLPLINAVIADNNAAKQAVLEAETLKAEVKQQTLTDDLALAEMPINKRRENYPIIERHLEALYAARQGDSSLLDTIDQEITDINARYPL